MNRDKLLEKHPLEDSKTLQEYEELIKEQVLRHKKIYEGFRGKAEEFKNSLFEDYQTIMNGKGYKVEVVNDKLRVGSSESIIEFYERNERVYLNFKTDTSTVKITNSGRVDFKSGIVDKLFILYITSNIEGKMFDFGGWSFYEKLTCSSNDYDYALDYYKKEYYKLKNILDEQIKILNEIDRSTFIINLKLFVNEGALSFGGGHEKQIGKFNSLQEVINKAIELI